MKYAGEVFCADINAYSEGAIVIAIQSANHHSEIRLTMIKT